MRWSLVAGSATAFAVTTWTATAVAQSYQVHPYREPPPAYYVDADDPLARPYPAPRGWQGPYPIESVPPPARYSRQDPRLVPPDPYWMRPPADIPDPPTGSITRAPLVPGGYSTPQSLPADPRVRQPVQIDPQRGQSMASLPPEYQAEETTRELPAQFKRQLVNFHSREPVGTVVIDSANTYLYFVLGHGQAVRYGIGVGREGFTWSGVERVSRMAEWPDWHPPAEMIERQPYLPRFMAGGPGNPLGARALYLGKTLYRIHGTNQPSTIGQFVSSGCIRLLNEDVEDLYSRVTVGTRVVVLPGRPRTSAAIR